MKMFTRAGRAALFDRKAFTEAFFDDDAAADGAIVVAGVGAVSYLGRLVWLGNLGFFTLSNLFAFVVAAVVSWLVLSFATWFSGSRLFGSSGRPQRMIAMQGLAALPLLLEVFGGLLAESDWFGTSVFSWWPPAKLPTSTQKRQRFRFLSGSPRR